MKKTQQSTNRELIRIEVLLSNVYWMSPTTAGEKSTWIWRAIWTKKIAKTAFRGANNTRQIKIISNSIEIAPTGKKITGKPHPLPPRPRDRENRNWKMYRIKFKCDCFTATRLMYPESLPLDWLDDWLIGTHPPWKWILCKKKKRVPSSPLIQHEMYTAWKNIRTISHPGCSQTRLPISSKWYANTPSKSVWMENNNTDNNKTT